MDDDWKLLQAYAAEGSEDAFRTVVDNYVGLVYSAALRQTRNPHLAEEVTQAVFVVLARKAGSLRRGTILTGWLFRATRFAAARAVRTEQRRRAREQEAALMHFEPETQTPWDEIEPMLDDALAGLGETDRHAVLLRFFARKELKEVGQAIGSSEEAAKKRVSRALEKLRAFLLRRGIAFSATALGLAMMENAVQAAPIGLSSNVSASIAAGTGSAVTLGLATMKAMFYAQLKTAATALGILTILAGGGAFILQKALAKEQPPEARALLQSVLAARQGVNSGEMELEEFYFNFERPKSGTNYIRRFIQFEGQKLRAEAFQREHVYTLQPSAPEAVSEAKLKELDYDVVAMERLGLLHYEDAHYIGYFDGTVYAGFKEGNNEARISEGKGFELVEPRVLGLVSGWPSINFILEKPLGLYDPGSLQCLGREKVNGVETWHVRVQLTFQMMDIYMDVERPERVVRRRSTSQNGSLEFTSKFDALHPEDPLPIEVEGLGFMFGKPSYQVRMVRGKSKYNVQVEPKTWTLATLGMPVGTLVSDMRGTRRFDFWNGVDLQSSYPRNAVKAVSKPRQDDFGKLVAVMESEPKTPLGLGCALHIMRYASDGPEIDKAADVIVREHAAKKELSSLPDFLRKKPNRGATRVLRAIVASNPEADTQMRARYALARVLKQEIMEGGQQSEAKTVEAEAALEYLMQHDAQTRLEGRPVGERANNDLLELRSFRPGKPAPDMVGQEVGGQTLSLKDYRGKVVLLVFSKRSAGAEKTIYPWLRTLLAGIPGSSFQVLGVMVDTKEKDLRASIKAGEVTWPCWWDGHQGPICTEWNVESVPSLCLLDRNGVIRYRGATVDKVESLIRGLMTEPVQGIKER